MKNVLILALMPAIMLVVSSCGHNGKCESMDMDSMKHKRTMVAMCAVCIATAAVCSFYQTTVNEGDLLSANIEAFTEENTGVFKFPTAHAYKMTCNAEISKRKTCKVEYWDCQGSGYGCNPSKCPDHNHEL